MRRIVRFGLAAAAGAGGFAAADAQMAAGHEVRAAPPPPMAAMIPLPATREQVKAMADAHFGAIDADHDGLVTRDELSAALPSHGDVPPVRGGMMRAMFDRMDANHDGKVSAAEAERVALDRFDGADTDRDGKLSDAERAAARKRLLRYVKKGSGA